MNIAVIATLIYGSLTLVGGILGYTKARSLPSLISGVISGVVLLGAAILQTQGIIGAKWLASALIILLIIVFIVRWLKTKKIMPAGIMVVVGVICLVLILQSAN